MSEQYDWVQVYTEARDFLGWSHEEFLEATPRRFFAVLYKLNEINTVLFGKKEEVLVGKSAFNALSQMARYLT